MRDQGGLAQARGIHEFRNGISLLRHALLGGYVGEAKTGKVEGNRAKSSFGKRAEIAQKHIRRASERGAVQKQHRWTRTFFDIAELQPINVNELVFRFGSFHVIHDIVSYRRQRRLSSLKKAQLLRLRLRAWHLRSILN